MVMVTVRKLVAGKAVTAEGGWTTREFSFKRRRSWMEQLAAWLDLSVSDLWIIGLTLASLGALYLIGEVAAWLSRG